MDRRSFIRSGLFIPFAFQTMNQKIVNQLLATGDQEIRMPVLFVGHGSPMNAIEDNEFSRTWESLGKTLPKPKAILFMYFGPLGNPGNNGYGYAQTSYHP